MGPEKGGLIRGRRRRSRQQSSTDTERGEVAREREEARRTKRGSPATHRSLRFPPIRCGQECAIVNAVLVAVAAAPGGCYGDFCLGFRSPDSRQLSNGFPSIRDHGKCPCILKTSTQCSNFRHIHPFRKDRKRFQTWKEMIPGRERKWPGARGAKVGGKATRESEGTIGAGAHFGGFQWLLPETCWEVKKKQHPKRVQMKRWRCLRWKQMRTFPRRGNS